MNEQLDNDQLIERLKKSTAADLPRFSTALHGRIMRQIASAEIEPPTPARFDWRIPLSLAAMVLLTAGTFVFLQHRVSRVSRTEVARAVPSMPAIDNPISALDQSVATNWPGDRYAALDQDGQRFLRFMGRELDVAPPARGR